MLSDRITIITQKYEKKPFKRLEPATSRFIYFIRLSIFVLGVGREINNEPYSFYQETYWIHLCA